MCNASTIKNKYSDMSIVICKKKKKNRDIRRKQNRCEKQMTWSMCVWHRIFGKRKFFFLAYLVHFLYQLMQTLCVCVFFFVGINVQIEIVLEECWLLLLCHLFMWKNKFRLKKPLKSIFFSNYSFRFCFSLPFHYNLYAFIFVNILKKVFAVKCFS